MLYAIIATGLFGYATYYTRRHQPALFKSWLLLTLALTGFLLTILAWTVIEFVVGLTGNMAMGAGFLLVSHILFGGAVYFFPQRSRNRLHRVREFIDLSTVLLGFLLLLWIFWLEPLLLFSQLNRSDIAAATLFLCSDLVLIAVLFSLLLQTHLLQPRAPLFLISISLLTMLIADLIFGRQVIMDSYRDGGLADHVYLLAMVLAGTAAFLQRLVIVAPMDELPLSTQLQQWVTRLRVVVPPLLLSVIYMVLLLRHRGGISTYLVFAAVGNGVMFILISIHQVLGLLENVNLTAALRAELNERRQIQDELQQSNATLEQHVEERTKELLLLNDQLRTNEQKLRFDAFHDRLTGLPNRTAFIHELEAALQAFRNDASYRFGVLFLDFDGFKIVNDSLGHWLGDEFLIALARRLKAQIPIGNFAARLGGDEFVVLVENVLNKGEVLKIADELQRELRRPFEIRGYRLYTTASIGVVINDDFHQTAGDLLRDADIAMYRAKEAGKARCVVFDAAMRAHAIARLKLETALRNALARRELSLAYQPVWNVAEQRVTGFEALARWHSPEHGFVSPGEFIPVAEETGLIIPLGEWVLAEACQQLKSWQLRWPQAANLTVSVNISAHQLYQSSLVAVVQETLRKTGLSPQSLKLEITESIFMEDIELAIDTCTQLRDLGVCLQIDDFGTGYSSFNYLHRLPINTMKIDKSFIDLIDLGGQHVEIVRTIVTLAQNLQLNVIAEGVETQGQMHYVESLGCEQIQGYLISKPLEREAATTYIAETLLPVAGQQPIATAVNGHAQPLFASIAV
jgi:diguanylate cyclase (GGDEF)-like protein